MTLPFLMTLMMNTKRAVKKAYLYGLPYEYYEKYKVRRYGFHGTSHSFVSKACAEYLKLDLKNSKIIVAHLGNGASVSAVLNGEWLERPLFPEWNC